MKRPIGYVAADVEGMEAGALTEALAQCGYQAIDWTMEQFDPLEEPPGRLVELVGLAAGNGLAVPQLMVHQDYVTADASEWDARVQRSVLAVDAAAQAGVPSVGLVTGPNRWVDGWARVPQDLGGDRAWELVTGALERVLARAEGTGVRVALEPCWGTLAWNAEETDRLLARVGSDNLALNLDPSHFVMTGDDPAELARRWRERVAHVHLKDAFGVTGLEGEDFCFLLPGEGATDWRAFFAALDEIGYDGTMSVEFESFGLRDQALDGSVLEGARLAGELVRGLLRGASR